MTKTLKALEQLVAMAIDADDEKRRDLFHAVTELYLANPNAFDERERALFGEVIGAVLFDVDVPERLSLSKRLAVQSPAPRNLLLRLLHDVDEVSQPILLDCGDLNDEDLVPGLEERTADELAAMAQRDDLTEVVTDAILDLNVLSAINILLRNQTAQIGSEKLAAAIDTISSQPGAVETIINKNKTRNDHLAEIFFVVSHRHRVAILSALQSTSDRTSELTDKATDNTNSEQQLVELLRTNQQQAFENEFADVLGGQAPIIQRIAQDKYGEALAVACKAAGFHRATFSTFVLLINPEQQHRPHTIHRLMSLFESLDVPTAQYLVGLWTQCAPKDDNRETNAA